MYEIPSATAKPAAVNAAQTTKIFSDRTVGGLVLWVMRSLAHERPG